MNDRLTNPVGEAALLGAMMIDNALIVEFSGRLRADDFGEAVHGRIFNALIRFAAKGMKGDAITLRPIFQNDSDARYGEYLDELVDNQAAVVGAKDFADQIIDLAARRAARESMHRAMEALATDFDRPIGEIVGGVEEAVWAAEERTDIGDASDVGEMIGAVEERDERINNDPGAVGMMNAFISDLDRGLGPLETSTYTIVAGRPGMGKSVLASSAALGYAANGHAGSYFHLEMKKEQQAMRVAADLSFAMGQGIEHAALKKGGLSQADRVWLAQVRERAALLPLRYRALNSGTDIKRIWSLVARHKAMWAARGHKLKFVVIDYLGLCSATDADGRPIENERQRMNVISATVRRMADELDVAVIALAQLSRAVEARQSKRPVVADLKESGNLEQDADAVLLLYREEAYLQEEEPKRGEMGPGNKDLHEQWETDMNIVRGKVDLIVGKNRHAEKRTRTAKFIGKHYAIRGGDVDEYGQEQLLI